MTFPRFNCDWTLHVRHRGIRHCRCFEILLLRWNSLTAWPLAFYSSHFPQSELSLCTFPLSPAPRAQAEGLGTNHCTSVITFQFLLYLLRTRFFHSSWISPLIASFKFWVTWFRIVCFMLDRTTWYASVSISLAYLSSRFFRREFVTSSETPLTYAAAAFFSNLTSRCSSHTSKVICSRL